MIPYYYFNAFEEALWLDDQKRAAERAELYFRGEVPDLVDRARIIEIERSLSHDPDLAEEVSHDFAPWTAPVPDDAEIQRGDPTVLSPEDVMGERALADLIAWANKMTPWEPWLWELVGRTTSGYVVPGDAGDLHWCNGRIWIDDTGPGSVPLAEYRFVLNAGYRETFFAGAGTYELLKDIEYRLASCDQDYVEPTAPVRLAPRGRKMTARWRVSTEDLLAWGEAEDWSKGLVGIFDLNNDSRPPHPQGAK